MNLNMTENRYWLLTVGMLIGLLLAGCQPIIVPPEMEDSAVSEANEADPMAPDLVGIWEWPARGALVRFAQDGSYAVGQSPYDFALGVAFDEGTWELAGNELRWNTSDESMFCAGMPAVYGVTTPSADELLLIQESDSCPQRSWEDGAELPPLTRTTLTVPTDVEEQAFTIDGKTLTLHCEGEGSPTVLLEAGIYDPWTVWWKIQPALAENNRVCGYTRAEPAEDEVRTAQDLADDLSGLLEAADLETPIILAAHSMGGYVARIFADQYGDKVAGLVLVDASHEDELESISGVMPDDIYQEIVEWETSLPDGVDLRASADQARAVTDLGDIPLVVITAAGDVESDLPPDVGAEIDAIWLSLQAELANLSTAGKQMIAEGSGHNVHLDQPDVVIEGIEDVITSVRIHSK